MTPETPPTLPPQLTHWLNVVSNKHPALKRSILTETFSLGYQLTTKDTTPNFNKSLDMATQLLTLNSDTETIAAALLSPYFDQSEKTKRLIHTTLTPTIYKLLVGTKRMEAIDKLPSQHHTSTVKPKQLDNLRRMLLAIVDDVRIVLIKLADRIATLQQLKHEPEHVQLTVANQTLSLYAPLANRLGIGQFKWQLEDLSFRFLNSQQYTKISKELNQRRTDRERFIEKMHHEINQLLQESNIQKYELSGRAKHIYSIYKKIERKQVALEQIYDTNAFRVLVPTIKDCYSLLSLFHEKYDYVPEEFDDYIAKPKPNGYRSIHTVIIVPPAHHVEIQLRTYAIHLEAELGVAAHWKYKEGHGLAESYENKIGILRDLIGWQQELDHPNQNHNALYQKLFEDRVYVFTPKNDVLDLPKKATPLDAAYMIHTAVGHRCKGAKINGKMVPLTEQVHTGDVVEILTGKENAPSRDWINPARGYLTTPSAIHKVKSWFRRLHHEEKSKEGLELWEKAAKREGLGKSDLHTVLKDFNVKTVDDLFVGMSLGQIPVGAIIRKLKPSPHKTNIDPTPTHTIPATVSPSIANTQNLLTQLARCCNPIPGDTISGYITKGRGVTIHRQDCSNLLNAQTQFPERILEVTWGDKTEQKYPINITLYAVERSGLIRDVSTLISNEKIRLLGINSQIKADENLCIITLTVEIESLDTMQRLLNQLQQLPDIQKAARKLG